MNKKRLIIGGILVVLVLSIVIFSSIYIGSKNKINVVLNVSKNVLELNDNPDRNMYIKQSYTNQGCINQKIKECRKRADYSIKNQLAPSLNFYKLPNTIVHFLLHHNQIS